MQKRRSGKSSSLSNENYRRSPDPLLILIGARIRKAREAAGFTQDRFSFAAEIERAYYGSVERGQRNLTVATLVKIARHLQADPGQLLPTLGEAKKLATTSLDETRPNGKAKVA